MIDAGDFLIGMAVGCIIGWVWRSLQFAKDHECADPNHKK